MIKHDVDCSFETVESSQTVEMGVMYMNNNQEDHYYKELSLGTRINFDGDIRLISLADGNRWDDGDELPSNFVRVPKGTKITIIVGE